MRKIPARLITEKIKGLCIAANCQIGTDVITALKRQWRRERKPVAREVLKMILENAAIARTENRPACQDTGYAVVWLAVGHEVMITGGTWEQAVQQGVRQGYEEGYFRASIVKDPFRRENTGTNTPAVIHYLPAKGDKVKITFEVKGGGSENMSRSAMLRPSEGPETIKEMVLGWIKDAGAKPCPPVIVGIGIGGDFEECALIAKQALLRPVGKRHADPFYARMEDDLLKSINRLGIGVQGLGGITTALDVHIEARPCHIACLPLAMNLDCHAHRVKSVVI